MIHDLMYIELKTGYSDDGPAWIGYVKTSKDVYKRQVETTVALIRVSMAAVFRARPPQPQIPRMPIRSGSTPSWTER